MKNVQVDADGNLRCWKCGASGFTEKRTARSKVMFGVGALATKKKLRCRACGEYNDVGSADPVGGAKGSGAAEPVAAAGRKVRADELQPGDVIRWLGTTATVESVEAGKVGLRIKTSTGMLRGIARGTEFTVQRPNQG